MPNYLHDFSRLYRKSYEKNEGLKKALEIPDVNTFKKSDRYSKAILDLRKGIKTTRFVKITDILDFLDKHINDEVLELYAIEKGLNLVEHYDASRDLIKTIMNKFDKGIRDVNKDLLEQYGLTIKVQRKSEKWKYTEKLSDIALDDKRKVELIDSSNDDSTARPRYTITVSFPMEHMEVIINNNTSCIIPVQYLWDTSRITVNMEIDYRYNSFLQLFIDNAEKLKDWVKNPDEAKKAILKYIRTKNFDDTPLNQFFRVKYWSDNHPYLPADSRRSNPRNWCYGSYQELLHNQYKDMKIQEMSITLKQWFTTYDIQNANPYVNINKFYNWLPDSIENAKLMPHSEEQASRCWSSLRREGYRYKHRECRNRNCAFIETCVEYNNNEETTESRNEISKVAKESYPMFISIADAAQIYAAHLETINNISNADKEGFHRELRGIKEWQERNAYCTDMIGDDTTITHVIDAYNRNINDFAHIRSYNTNNPTVLSFLDSITLYDLYQMAYHHKNLLSSVELDKIYPNSVSEPTTSAPLVSID